MRQRRSPRLCASPGVHHSQSPYSCWHDTGFHCAAGPRVQWGTISSGSPPLPGSLALGAPPLFQRVRETAQRPCIRSPGGALFGGVGVTHALGDPGELGVPPLFGWGGENLGLHLFCPLGIKPG